MEPVELDIRMRQNVDAESKKAKDGIAGISDAVAKAKNDIERHTVAVVELKKDLVELGGAYKQATSKEGKSEILTEIELTKKNILDERESIRQLKAELASLNKVKPANVLPDASQVGKAAVGYNSLNYSTQQLVRELPAASMGINTFFLAISNNIPVLTDGIKRAKAEVSDLKSKGLESVPVWKQLMSSIFSWQSLMMVGITVVSMYGKEIFSAFTKGSDAAKIAKENIEKFNDTLSSSASKPLASIQSLSDKWNKLGDNLEEKKKFVDDNKDAFHDLGVEVNNVKDAENLLVTNKDAFVESLIAKARAAAGMELAAESYKKAISKMAEVEKMPNKVDRYDYGSQSITGMSSLTISRVDNNAKTKGQEEIKALNEAGDNYIKQSNKDAEKANALLEAANIKRYEKEKNNRERSHTEAYNSETDFQKLIYSLTEKSESMLIGLKEDSLSKRLELIQQEKDKELNAIKDKEIAIIEEYNKTEKKKTDEYNKTHKTKNVAIQLSTKPEDIGMSLSVINPVQAQQLSDATLAVENAFSTKSISEKDKWQKEMLALGVKYGDEKVRIETEYDARILKLLQGGYIIEASEVHKERDEKLGNLESSLIKETDLYKLASDDRLKLTRELNKKLIEEAKAKIKADKSLTPEDKKKLLDNIDTANVDKASNAIDGLITQFGRLKKAKEDAAKAKASGDTVGEVKAAKDIAETTSSIEKYGNEVLNYFDQVSSGVIGIMDQLGMFTEEEKQSANEIVGMVSGAGDLAVGIATGNIGQIISGGLSLVTNAISFFDKKSKDIAKKQKAIEKNIDSLTAAYARLQRQVDKALGTDVYDAQKSQIENLRAQIIANNAWIEQEQRKKKKKQDAAAIASKKAEIESLKNEIEDVTASIAEDLAQTTAKELAQQVGDALVQAAADGTDAFTAMGDVVNDVLKSAVTNALEKQFLEKQMQGAVDYLSSAMVDGKLSDTEKQQFAEMVTKAGNNYNEALQAYKDILGSSDTAREGAKKGIATASQDSIDELNGGIYALRIGVADIRNNSREQTVITRTMTNQLDRLIDNTEPIAAMSENIEKMSNDINDMKTRGINVKV